MEVVEHGDLMPMKCGRMREVKGRARGSPSMRSAVGLERVSIDLNWWFGLIQAESNWIESSRIESSRLLSLEESLSKQFGPLDATAHTTADECDYDSNDSDPNPEIAQAFIFIFQTIVVLVTSQTAPYAKIVTIIETFRTSSSFAVIIGVWIELEFKLRFPLTIAARIQRECDDWWSFTGEFTLRRLVMLFVMKFTIVAWSVHCFSCRGTWPVGNFQRITIAQVDCANGEQDSRWSRGSHLDSASIDPCSIDAFLQEFEFDDGIWTGGRKLDTWLGVIASWGHENRDILPLLTANIAYLVNKTDKN